MGNVAARTGAAITCRGEHVAAANTMEYPKCNAIVTGAILEMRASTRAPGARCKAVILGWLDVAVTTGRLNCITLALLKNLWSSASALEILWEMRASAVIQAITVVAASASARTARGILPGI